MTIGPKNIRIERTPTRYLSDVSGPIRNAVLARPGVDLIIVVVVVAAYGLAVARGMPDVIAAIPSTHRLIVYGALATVATLTAGTTNSAVAIYQGTSGTIIEAVRATYGQEIRKNFRSITVWLWIACLLLVLALLIDIDGSTRHPAGSPDGAQYMFLSALVLVILKFARLAFLQDLFLRANDASNGKRKK